MSNSITYYNRYNVKDIYDVFNKNRVNKISLGTTNEYISCAVGTNYAYIYADESSEKLNEDYIGCAYFKVNETSYNFYRNYSYTYTESVNGNILLNVNPILFAYDFVNKTNDNNEFKFNHVNISHNSGTETVNTFSDITYNIEKENITSNNYYNEYKISTADIKNLLSGETYGDFTTYINYSYIKSEASRTGVVHIDGKQRLFNNECNDIHVWSLKQKDNDSISYLDIEENEEMDILAYVSYGKIFNNLPFNSYVSFDINGRSNNLNLAQLPYNIENDINDDTYIRIKNVDSNFLINNCYYNNLTTTSFDEIYNKPSLRNNESKIISYAYIKGRNKDAVLYSNINNYNEVKFEKEIYNLPIAILGDKLYFNRFSNISDSSNTDGGVTLNGFIIFYSGGILKKNENNIYELSYNEIPKLEITVSCVAENENIVSQNISITKNDPTNTYIHINYTTPDREVTDDRSYIQVTSDFIDKSFNVAYIYSKWQNVSGNKKIRLNMNGHAKGDWHTSVPAKSNDTIVLKNINTPVSTGTPWDSDAVGKLYIDAKIEYEYNN